MRRVSSVNFELDYKEIQMKLVKSFFGLSY